MQSLPHKANRTHATYHHSLPLGLTVLSLSCPTGLVFFLSTQTSQIKQATKAIHMHCTSPFLAPLTRMKHSCNPVMQVSICADTWYQYLYASKCGCPNNRQTYVNTSKANRKHAYKHEHTQTRQQSCTHTHTAAAGFMSAQNQGNITATLSLLRPHLLINGCMTQPHHTCTDCIKVGFSRLSSK